MSGKTGNTKVAADTANAKRNIDTHRSPLAGVQRAAALCRGWRCGGGAAPLASTGSDHPTNPSPKKSTLPTPTKFARSPTNP